jgi:hypothetical protein
MNEVKGRGTGARRSPRAPHICARSTPAFATARRRRGETVDATTSHIGFRRIAS